ncbi:MAG: hypothetical protein WCD70_05960 [Alphaproteobacteria bacterium]
MSWLVILLVLFAGLHLGLLVPTQLAIVGAAMLTVGLWLVWKLKWVILGIIGLEEFFGGGDGGA